MLGIKIRGSFISLYPGTSLTLEWDHPIGIITEGVELIHSGYSFPIRVPLDQVNLGVMGHVGRVDIDTTLITDEYCELWADGIFLYTGLVTINDTTDTDANLYMVFNEVKPIAELQLSAVDLGGVRTIGADKPTRLAHALATATAPLDHDYVFCPVLNPIFNTDPTGLNTSFVSSHLQNEWDPEDEAFVEVGAGYASPFIRLDYLLARIFREMGYTLDNQWQITDELKQILIYNNRSIYSDFDSWSTTIDLADHVPYRTCIELINAVIGTYALGLFPDPLNKRMLLIPFRDLILAPVHMDITHRIGQRRGISTKRDYVSKYRYDIDPADALSVQYSGVTFNQTAVIDEGLTVYDLAAEPVIGICYVQSDNTYYLVLADDPDLNCSYLLQDQKQIDKGTTKLDYISPLIPMWSSWQLGLDGLIHEDTDELEHQAWLVPHIRMTGYSLTQSWLSRPQHAFRTMIYRGMQPYNVGTIDSEYPMAGVTQYNILGDVVGDISLLWDGDAGVYNQWWKLVYQMLAARKTVVRDMRIDIGWLLQFRFYQKYRVENQNVFITKLRFSISDVGISTAEMTMITTL